MFWSFVYIYAPTADEMRCKPKVSWLIALFIFNLKRGSINDIMYA